MKLYMRQAAAADLDEIMAIIEGARRGLALQGIPQWQDGTGPNSEIVKKDMSDTVSYVLMLEDEIVGTGALLTAEDPAYEQIQEGSWDTTASRYVSIHRIAVSDQHQGKGFAVSLIRFLITAARLQGFTDIRIDTHPQNKIMQKVIQQAGFEWRGNILLDVPDGERYAYQQVLN
ncbi:GNAT family N-acetyltransferase [Enterococcus sp. LJL128]